MKSLRRRTNRRGVQLARRRMSQARRSVSRGLFAERLEDRRLLSGVETPYHNAIVPIDVSRDWLISPRDALLVINELNDGGARALDTSLASNDPDRKYVDTNGDNVISPVDALLVINALSNGESEPGDVVGFRLELQNASGVAIQPLKDAQNNVILDIDGDPIYPVRVGDQFRVQIYVDDLRPPIDNYSSGVFEATMDVAYNDPSLFSLNGTKPDDFTSTAQFKSFFTTSTFIGLDGNTYRYSTSLMNVYPSAMNIDASAGTPGANAANEFDELQTSFLFFATPPDPAILGPAERPFVYATLTADNVGKLTFSLNQSDFVDPPPPLPPTPLNDILVFGDDTAVDVSVVDFGFPLHVTIVKPVNAEDDAYPVAGNVIDEDGGAVDLNVLVNDFLQSGSTGILALDPAGLTPAGQRRRGDFGVADPLHSGRQLLRHRHVRVPGRRWAGQLGYRHRDGHGQQCERPAGSGE